MARMQVTPLVTSIIALLGLWMVLRHVPDFAVSLTMVLFGQEDISARVLTVHAVHFFSNTLIGLCLILLREKLGRWLVPQTAGVLVSASAWLAVGTALMGIYFVAMGAVSFGESFAQPRPSSNPYLLWRGSASVVMGVLLFVGSAGIGRLWALLLGLRRAGW